MTQRSESSSQRSKRLKDSKARVIQVSIKTEDVEVGDTIRFKVGTLWGSWQYGPRKVKEVHGTYVLVRLGGYSKFRIKKDEITEVYDRHCSD